MPNENNDSNQTPINPFSSEPIPANQPTENQTPENKVKVNPFHDPLTSAVASVSEQEAMQSTANFKQSKKAKSPGWYLWVSLCSIPLVIGFALFILHAFLRDSLPAFATLYYATPLIYAIPLPLLALVGYLFAKSWKLSAIALIVAGLVTYQWRADNFDSFEGVGMFSPDLQILLWNINTGMEGLEGVKNELAGIDVDFVAMIEANNISDKQKREYRDAMPSLTYYAPGENRLLLLSRFPVTQTTPYLTAEGAKFAEYLIETKDFAADPIAGEHPTRTIRMILVDMPSDEWADRTPYFTKLHEIIGNPQNMKYPTILAGDFNLPLGSVHFDKLRENFTHTFDYAGNGYNATYPVPNPLLHIDHIWVSRTSQPLDITDCRHIESTYSDHRAVLTGLRWPTIIPATPNLSTPTDPNQP